MWLEYMLSWGIPPNWWPWWSRTRVVIETEGKFRELVVSVLVVVVVVLLLLLATSS